MFRLYLCFCALLDLEQKVPVVVSVLSDFQETCLIVWSGKEA